MNDTSSIALLANDASQSPDQSYRPLQGSTVAEVASRKCISRASLYNEARAGRIKLSKVCGRTVIFEQDEAEYDALIRAENEARRNSPKPPKAA